MNHHKISPESVVTCLGEWGRPAQLLLLLTGSAVLAMPLEMARLPAALLLGPMFMAIAMGSAGTSLRVPAPLFMVAQVIIGCLMAQALPSAVFVELVVDWPIYAVGIFSVVAVAAGIGIVLTRLQVLPGTTAIWGSAPGGASVMVVMSESFNADPRLVAFMTYLRVVIAACLASGVARLVGPEGVEAVPVAWMGPVDPSGIAQTLALIVVSLIIVRLTRVPGGGILVPMVLGCLAQNLIGMRIELPPLLLGISFALIGWTIGLRFTRPILRHAWRALPAVLVSLLALIGSCAIFAGLLVWLAGIDPLTAYLATSPGGADSVAIIAAGSDVDVPFVMAMQAGRMMVVLVTGPWLARYIATRNWAQAL